MAEQAGAPPPSPPKVTKAESPASLLSSSPPSQLFQPSSLQSAPLSSSLQLSLLSKAPLSPVLPSPSKAFEPIAATSKAGATGMGTSHLARKCNDDVNNAKHDEIKAGLSVKPPYNSAAIGKGSGASSSTNCDRTVKCDGAGASSTAKLSNIKTACLKGGSEGDSSPLPTLSTAMVGAGAELSLSRYTEWMPSLQKSKPSRECIRRVRNDIRTLMRDPVSGLFVYPDEDLVSVVHALVTGPFDTPYEGGFFYFLLHCPDDYPHNPPRVRLMTTGGGAVRFNPNLYANGKVCLSILGTWSGPRWTPVQSIFSVLLSIQSLMSEKPYHNEPGFEVARNPQDVRDYSDCITHETLRVAVCSMVEDSSVWRSMPECFQGLTRDLFLSFIPRYELVCEQNIHRDGERMIDPFGQNMGTFQFGAIQRCIAKIARMLEAPPVPPAAATAETAAGTTERERDDLKPSCRETPVAASAKGVDCTVAPDGEMASQCFEGDGEKGLSECSVSDAKDAKGRGS